jgi:RNA polymerase sigma-70 factor (ECF subfamily)
MQRGRARHFDRDADTDAVASSAASPERDVAEQRRKAKVRDLLDELPAEQAEALALRFMLGFSLEEVAESSGVPVNTVRSRVRLAKEALLKRLALEPALWVELEIEP